MCEGRRDGAGTRTLGGERRYAGGRRYPSGATVVVAEVVRVNGRPYSAFGEVLDELARKRNVRGPQHIADYMKARLGEAPTGTAVGKWMYAEASPTRENLRRFADAFELSEGEEITLSFAFNYGQQPPEGA
jgi:hypothetical protein